MITQLTPRVHWVGYVDWARRQFHGFELSTHRGTSYNSYLIMDEKIVLVDTAWSLFEEEFLAHVSEVVDPARIDYIVVNHAEPDHSGCLPALVEKAPNATVVVSKRGMDSVVGHYHGKWNLRPVGTGDRIKIGANELVFVEAPMLHWPDSMFTYLTADRVLLPNDAFGQHYATEFHFNDQVDQAALYQEALKYYANIITPFSSFVTKKIDELLAMNLPIDMIAPSHGVIWRKDPLQIVKQYQVWAQQVPEKRAVVLYDTMWEATRRMAEAISAGLTAEGVANSVYHMAASDRNDVLTDIFRSKAVVIGGPTVNRVLVGCMMPILEEMRGLKFQNKIGAAFGSYGWSGEGVGIIEEHLRACKIPLICEGLKVKWQPDAEALQSCENLGRKVAAAIKAG